MVASLMSLMRWTTKLPKEKTYTMSLFWIGGTERLIATTLVILAPRYVGPFIATWVALKLAASWQRMPGSKESGENGNNAFAGRQRLVVSRRNRGGTTRQLRCCHQGLGSKLSMGPVHALRRRDHTQRPHRQARCAIRS
jgi:hypothetical protein